MYFGPLDKIYDHFESCGVPCDRTVNPADFIVDLTHTKEDEGEEEEDDDEDDDEPPLLKAIENMKAKELAAELDDGGVPKEGRSINKNHVSAIRDLVRRLRDGEDPATIKLLKALENMTRKELDAELDKADVPKKGRGRAGGGATPITIADIQDLVRRLRAGEAPATIKVPRKPKSAEELFVLDKEEQVAARARPAASREFSFARSTQGPVPS